MNSSLLPPSATVRRIIPENSVRPSCSLVCWTPVRMEVHVLTTVSKTALTLATVHLVILELIAWWTLTFVRTLPARMAALVSKVSGAASRVCVSLVTPAPCVILTRTFV